MMNDYDKLEVGKICGIEYLGPEVLIIPESELCGDDADYDEAIWHIDLDGKSGTACGHEAKGDWLECTRIAPVNVCPKCQRIEAEKND